MAFILGSLVSEPFATAQMGTPFLQEEIDAIEEIIEKMQEQLKNIRVAWVNVTHTPPGFAKDTFTGGIFQGNTSSIVELCNAGDVVTWNATHWVCDDIGVVAPNVILLHYDQTGQELVPATAGTVFKLIAEWKIEKDPALDYIGITTILYDSSVYANIFGDVDIGWYKSVDEISWKKISRISASTGAFEVKNEFEFINDFPSKINYIAFGTTNPSAVGGPDGKVKDFSGTMTIHLPPGQSLMRLK